MGAADCLTAAVLRVRRNRGEPPPGRLARCQGLQPLDTCHHPTASHIMSCPLLYARAPVSLLLLSPHSSPLRPHLPHIRRSRSRTPAPPSRSWSRSRARAACPAGWPSWVSTGVVGGVNEGGSRVREGIGLGSQAEWRSWVSTGRTRAQGSTGTRGTGGTGGQGGHPG